MSSDEALVTPELIIWARDRLKWSKGFAANALNIAIETYESWEKGTARPTLEEARNLAFQLNIPFIWLYLESPPNDKKMLKYLDFRGLSKTASNDSSGKIERFIADISRWRDIIIELHHDMEITPPRFEKYLDAKKVDARDIASAINSLLSRDFKEPLAYGDNRVAYESYRDKLTALGILVFEALDISQSVMRGMSFYEPLFPVIVVNGRDEYCERIFTLFHELAHIVTRSSGICDMVGIFVHSPHSVENKGSLNIMLNYR
ncbi:MAG: ImmA/IrrE family metallo-endopeptidase [Deltaproteobacteria bacterium]|jgi:Zn-dependent peptidase ImmA (M78 family)|nr:ImmA/IrrE family metallo-endopeptidase [Deltaproteobacteria bacterium]